MRDRWCLRGVTGPGVTRATGVPEMTGMRREAHLPHSAHLTLSSLARLTLTGKPRQARPDDVSQSVGIPAPHPWPALHPSPSGETLQSIMGRARGGLSQARTSLSADKGKWSHRVAHQMASSMGARSHPKEECSQERSVSKAGRCCYQIGHLVEVEVEVEVDTV